MALQDLTARVVECAATYTARFLQPGAPADWGAGQTTPWLTHPPGTDKFTCALRVSTATVLASSDWNVFPDQERLMALTSGRGFRLTRKDTGRPVATVDHRGRRYRFNAGVPLHCDLLNGPSADFTVLVNPSQADAALRVFDRGERGQQVSLHQVDAYLLHCAVGSVVAQCSDFPLSVKLESGQTWLLERSAGGPAYLFLHPSRRAQVLGVRIQWK